MVLAFLISGALAEELMFRGYPFQRLVEAIGAAGAIVVFSVLFGVVHLSNPGASVWGLVNTVAIGVLLSIVYLRTRSLWLPWGLHFAWNTTLGLFSAYRSADSACSTWPCMAPPAVRGGSLAEVTESRPAHLEHSLLVSGFSSSGRRPSSALKEPVAFSLSRKTVPAGPAKCHELVSL